MEGDKVRSKLVKGRRNKPGICEVVRLYYRKKKKY